MQAGWLYHLIARATWAFDDDVHGEPLRTLRVVGSVLLLMAMVAPGQGCSAPGTPQQVPGRQVIAGRDLRSPFFWNPSTVAFIRSTQAAGAGGGDDVWVLPLDPADGSAEPHLAAENVDWALGPHTLVGDLLITGDRGEQVFDLQSRSRVSLDSVGRNLTTPSFVPGVTFPFVGIDYSAARRDGGVVAAYSSFGRSSLLVGRPPDFTRIADIVVTGMDFLGTDLAVLGHPFGAPDGGQMDTMAGSLYRMAIPSGELTQFPVPTFAPAVPGELECGVIAQLYLNDLAPCLSFRVAGCRASDAPCPGSDHSPCAILYQRTVDDGATPPTRRPVAYDVVSGQEIALPGQNPSGFWISPDQHRVAWMSSATSSKDPQSPADEPAVYFRDFCTGAAGQWALPAPEQLDWWRSDSELLVASLSGPNVALLRFPTGEFTILDGSAGIFDLQFSPGNQHLVWTSSLSSAEGASVAISDGRGDGARLLAAGHVAGFQFSPDGQRASITRFQNGLISAVWVNLADVPPVEHPLAAASGGAEQMGNRRALSIDRWNTQDATGTLELIDLDGGSRQDLARDVSAFAVSGSPDDATEVAYVVHGRFGSNHDGLWLTTLPASP